MTFKLFLNNTLESLHSNSFAYRPITSSAHSILLTYFNEGLNNNEAILFKRKNKNKKIKNLRKKNEEKN